jgi:hypothetical protein
MEVAAAIGGARVIAGCIQWLQKTQGVKAEVEALRERLLAIATTLAGPDGERDDGLANDLRLKPLRELLGKAVGWTEVRVGKLETQSFGHKFIMATAS